MHHESHARGLDRFQEGLPVKVAPREGSEEFEGRKLWKYYINVRILNKNEKKIRQFLPLLDLQLSEW